MIKFLKIQKELGIQREDYLNSNKILSKSFKSTPFKLFTYCKGIL